MSGAAAERAGLSSLHLLNTGDPQLAAVLQKLKRVQGSDIPIMILGETGTGKDLLARAIHNDSPRARRPFVAINCASIPEALIESELFGYEEGAFTGARRRGSPGKIQMAHGGTLFLDEIGDMPNPLQARLLRVLQERRVTPLGSGKEYAVDVMLICATHCDLKSRIQMGLFRQDLYYRLNGLVLRLPALRERADFAVLAQKILLSLSGSGRPVALSPEVMRLFQHYHWPGNIRELHNLLRTASVMVGPGACIGLEHLPEDFLEEVQSVLAPNQPAEGSRASEPPATVMSFAQPDARVTRPEHGHIQLPTAVRLQDVALQTMTETLRQCKGNVSAAAKLLGVSRNTIYRKKDQLPPDVWA
jgi:transcriptional regulator with PAS, ATPase and Fis domain